MKKEETHVAVMKNVYRNLVRDSKEKTSLVRPGQR
jgi:hypothetical protein